MNSFKLNLDCGKSVAFNLDETQVDTLMSFPQVVEYMVWKGLKEILTDAHASVTRDGFKTDEEWIQAKRDKASLKLGALMTGDVRATSREKAPKADDFTNFARKHVLGLLDKAKRKALAESDDKGIAFLDAVFAKNETKLRPIVQAELDAAIAAAAAKAELSQSLDFDV